MLNSGQRISYISPNQGNTADRPLLIALVNSAPQSRQASRLLRSSICSSSLQQMKQEQRRKASCVTKAREDLQLSQSTQRSATANLLSGCPPVPPTLACPLAACFSFRPDKIATVRQCSTAMSLLMGSMMNVLLVPKMGDVQRCDGSDRALFHRTPVQPEYGIQLGRECIAV